MTKFSLVIFEQDPTLFLGIKMTKKQLPNNQFSVHLSQQVLIQNLMTEHNISLASITKSTPYRAEYPIDKVKHKKDLPRHVLDKAE